MKNKYIKLIVSIYLALLVIGTIVYYFIPKDKLMETHIAVGGIEAEKKLIAAYENITEIPKMKSEGDRNIESYSFNYEGNTLRIMNEDNQGKIFVDKKSTSDNKIEVYVYKASCSLSGIDITDKIKGPSVYMVNNYLNIEYEKQEYKYTIFPKDFTITQFYQKYDYKKDSERTGGGSSIIYVKIPKDLVILHDEEIKYVE